MNTNTSTGAGQKRIAFFVTCLVDMIRPSIGFAALKLLEATGHTVEVPESQSCCGQASYNSGDLEAARQTARRHIDLFEPYDYVVAPSGSCLAMIKTDYPVLFENQPEMHKRAVALSEKCFELLSFLDLQGVAIEAEYQGSVTYHDSCSGLRSLGVKHQPRNLLQKVKGLSLTEMNDAEVCCGFGGAFCVKFPEISNHMVTDKLNNILTSKADTLAGGDLGCLMNIAGKLSRQGVAVRCFHTAEILAGMTDGPGICATKGTSDK
jgi:L-lactate dehydrogenase complex protein LldE